VTTKPGFLGRPLLARFARFTSIQASTPLCKEAFFPPTNHEMLKPKIESQTQQVPSKYLIVLLLLVALPAYSAVREVGPVGLTVNDLDQEIRFFTQVLPFEEVSRTDIKGQPADELLGLQNANLRVVQLRLGNEIVILSEHESKGRQIPLDSRSYDHWFQHIAIVVRDMDKAFEHLRQKRVRYISTAPQTLPDWNKGAAGIKAFYFRDPEDHVLEIIWFPPGKGDLKWQLHGTNTFLGIDHTAIVVSDTEKSLALYRDFLGLRVSGESENYGVEQEHLNQVFGARLHITALRADHGPGIEFLEYITPPGGRNLAADAKPNDLIFWNTHIIVDDVAKLSAKLRESGVAFVSRPGNLRSQIVRDPDGHALEFDELSVPVAASAAGCGVSDPNQAASRASTTRGKLQETH